MSASAYQFEWAQAYFFWLLPLVFAAGYLHFRSQGSLLIVSRISEFQSLPWQWRVFLFKTLKVLRLLLQVLLVLALARPRFTHRSSEVLVHGVDILLAIDTSGSMKAEDFRLGREQVNRLTALKSVAKDFVSLRQHDRIGMVVFGSMAFTQCPLTMDRDLLNQLLDDLEIGMAGEQTAIGSAIGLGVQRLKELQAKSKVMILLTDGANTAGEMDPMQAAEIAASFGVRVYTIGIGTSGEAPVLVQTPMGPMYQYMRSDLDEDLLMNLASKTGGRYYRAQNTEELRGIYSEIDRMETSETRVREHTESQELFPYLLALSLVLIVLDLFLSATILRKEPV